MKALEEAFYPFEGMGGAPLTSAKKKSKAAESSPEQTDLVVAVEDESVRSPMPRLHEARENLSDDRAREIVLGILRDDLASKLEGHVVRGAGI